MTSLLLAPSDVLFFGEGSAPLPTGEGWKAGCGWPLPGTVHEAVRQALLRQADSGFPSLQLRGPLPWHPEHGPLFPVPLDACGVARGIRRHRLLPLPAAEVSQTADTFIPPCFPAPDGATGEGHKLTGWWTATQLSHYLAAALQFDPTPVPTSQLWVEESRCGGNGTYLRLRPGTRIAIKAGLVKASDEEKAAFDALLRQGQLLLGGDARLVHLERKNATWPVFEKPTPAPGEAPFHVRWTLLTPAIFRHGSLPGWCRPGPEDQPLPEGQVCLRERKSSPLLRAQLIAHHLGRPLPVCGVEGAPSPSLLAVPAGSVYHFLCADTASAVRLVSLLHDRTLSDFFSEQGCGHGLCATPEPLSAEVRASGLRLSLS